MGEPDAVSQSKPVEVSQSQSKPVKAIMSLIDGGIIFFISSLRASYLSFWKSPSLKKSSCCCYSTRKRVNVFFLTYPYASLSSWHNISSTSFSSCRGSLMKKSLSLMNLKDFFSFFSFYIKQIVYLSLSLLRSGQSFFLTIEASIPMTLATTKSALIVWLRTLRFFGLSCDLDLDPSLIEVFAVHIIDSFLD